MASLYSVATFVNYPVPRSIKFSHTYVPTSNLIYSGKLKVVPRSYSTVRCEVGNPGKQVYLADDLIHSYINLPDDLKRADFPSDFKFGACTSALQTEGSATEGKRGASTHDRYITILPDSYKNYKEDVKLLKDMGMNAYRFSIDWPKILPDGGGQVNNAGIEFYNKLIDALLKENIEPVITLFHSDQPQALQNKYDGFLSNQIIDDYKKYAEICFKYFGDRVKYWLTINEPLSFGFEGMKEGLPTSKIPSLDDPRIYSAPHNIILAHAAAAEIYHDKYQQQNPKGKIGISLGLRWCFPHSPQTQQLDGNNKLRWLMDPFVNGDYYLSMKDHAEPKGLPKFTDDEKKMLRKACDFISINHPDDNTSFGDLTKLLIQIKNTYNNPEIYVTDNGVLDHFKITTSVSQKNIKELEPAFLDDKRIAQAEKHLKSILKAIKEGANVKGYFMWTLMDNLELRKDGHEFRYGLNFTDYFDVGRKRYPKKSAEWFKHFL